MTEPWYIIAGGPSLIDFDWGLLPYKRVIAVNRAFEKLPYAEVVYFTDHRFWGWHRESLLNHRGRLITGASKKHVNHSRIENWKLTGTRGLDVNYRCIKHGNNSGYAAINVAYHLGARRIYLLGFDFKYSSKHSHWHSPHPTLHRERVFGKMLPHFSYLADDLKLFGVEVWNASPDSTLTCFRKCTINEAITNQPATPYDIDAITYPACTKC